MTETSFRTRALFPLLYTLNMSPRQDATHILTPKKDTCITVTTKPPPPTAEMTKEESVLERRLLRRQKKYHPVSCIARDFMEMCVLTKQNLYDLMDLFPKDANILSMIARLRYARTVLKCIPLNPFFSPSKYRAYFYHVNMLARNAR